MNFLSNFGSDPDSGSGIASRLGRMSVSAMTLAFLLMTTALSPTTGNAANIGGSGTGPWGFGIILGEPTGFTAKYIESANRAYDVGVSFAFDRYFLFWGDWQYHLPGVFGGRNEFVSRLVPYVGVGGFVAIANRPEDERRKYRYFYGSESSVAMGIRFPLGLEWRPSSVPVGVFVEAVPGMTFAPSTSAYLQGGVGARYFF